MDIISSASAVIDIARVIGKALLCVFHKMTSALKCVSCNIIIDELLAYIQNKVSLADEASLVKICASAFTTEQIQNSKMLLLESVSSEVRSTVRKGKGKENRVLNDIIGIFKASDPDVLPIFVARDLNKLPPITFDHLDVSQLLKDMVLMRNEINNIKSSYVTHEDLEKLKKQCDQNYYLSDEGILTKEMSPNHRNLNINNYEGSAKKSSVSTIRDDVARTSGTVGEGGRPYSSSQSPVNISLNDITKQLADNARLVSNKTYADAVSSEPLTKEGFTLVQRKQKYKNRFKGKLGASIVESDDKFKAADRKIPMFITNVHLDTAESDIVDYILKKTGEKVNLEKISIQRQCQYNAFKFFVSKSALPMYIDENLWPEGIIFRRFVNYRIKQKIDTPQKGEHGTKHVNNG